MNIAVYCGSSMGTDPAFADAASRLGEWIAGNDHVLVFGGGDSGLMGVLASAVYGHGGRVIGVVPANVPFIAERPQPYCTEVIKAPDMSARKDTMLTLADAMIALPGGIGTLDEISEAITLTQIGVQDKPCALLDTKGFYAPLRALFAGMCDAGFVRKDGLRRVLISDSIEEIGAFLTGR